MNVDDDCDMLNYLDNINSNIHPITVCLSKSDFSRSMLRTGRPDFDGVSAKTVVAPLASVSVLAALRLHRADCLRVFPGRERCTDARKERGTVSAASSSTTHTDRPTLRHRRPPPNRRTKRHRRPLRRRPYPGRTPSATPQPGLPRTPLVAAISPPSEQELRKRAMLLT